MIWTLKSGERCVSEGSKILTPVRVIAAFESSERVTVSAEGVLSLRSIFILPLPVTADIVWAEMLSGVIESVPLLKLSVPDIPALFEKVRAELILVVPVPEIFWLRLPLRIKLPELVTLEEDILVAEVVRSPLLEMLALVIAAFSVFVPVENRLKSSVAVIWLLRTELLIVTVAVEFVTLARTSEPPIVTPFIVKEVFAVSRAKPLNEFKLIVSALPPETPEIVRAPLSEPKLSERV